MKKIVLTYGLISGCLLAVLMDKNPVYVIGMTFLEVFPVGLVFALVGAAVLSRKKGDAMPGRPLVS